jgi:hypothetical protein
VSAHDVQKYRSVLLREVESSRSGGPLTGPVVCLGTRNGREVDLFRTQWSGKWLWREAVRWLERRTHSFVSWIPLVESAYRSDVGALTEASVVGVEVNPRGARRDVWIGSFDKMPSEWDRTFGVIYSNAFDQTSTPERTAREWKRVLRPGGFLIFCFTNDEEPTLNDPVGGLCLNDVQALFNGRLVYYSDRGSRNGYSEAIIQI